MSQTEMYDKPQPLDAKDLQEQATALYNEINSAKAGLDALKVRFTFDKDDNKLGLTKAVVKTTVKIAEIDAANTFEKLLEKRYAQEEFEEAFKKATNYDD